MSTLLIRLRDIRDIVARIGLNELMDRTIAVLTEALQETPLAQGKCSPAPGLVTDVCPQSSSGCPIEGVRAGP